MYYIYHIVGVKIGCSTQPIKRTKEQGFLTFEILEEHIDIYEASKREIELQNQYGYTVDKIPYWLASERLRKNATFGSASKGGKKGGETSKRLGHIQKAQKIGCSLGGKIGGKIAGKINGSKLAESGHMKIMAQKAKEKLSKPIIAFKNNTTINFTSISDASKELQIKIPNIVDILKGGRQKTAKGYTFKYK